MRKSEGRKTAWKSSLYLKGNIKLDLMAIGLVGVAWINSGQNSDKC